MDVCDTWLLAAATENQDHTTRSLVSIRAFIADAPTARARIVRLTGLIDYLARRCAAALPTKFDEFGSWIIRDGPFTGATIDDTAPEARVAIRLMIFYVNQDEVGARDLMLGYINGLPEAEMPDRLSDVFFCLTELYLWIRRNRVHCPKRTAQRDL